MEVATAHRRDRAHGGVGGRFLRRLRSFDREPVAQPWNKRLDQIAAEDAERLLPGVAEGVLAEIFSQEDEVIPVRESWDAPRFIEGRLAMWPEPVRQVLPVEGDQAAVTGEGLCERV